MHSCRLKVFPTEDNEMEWSMTRSWSKYGMYLTSICLLDTIMNLAAVMRTSRLSVCV